MTYQYVCSADIEDHTIERFYRGFAEAAPFIDEVICLEHGQVAKRVPSLPFAAHLYGSPDGYAKPSPTKRHSTKLVSSETGNKFSIG